MNKKVQIPTIPFLLHDLYNARKKKSIAWFFPEHLKQILQFKWRTITAKKRVLPDFIITGVPKCGTTSLFNYLMQSPDAEPPMCKEIHYFDLIFHSNTPWELPNLEKAHLIDRYRQEYSAFFPLKKNYDSANKFTGEATPSLFGHAGTHEIINKLVPDKTKFIAIVRNPVNQIRSLYYYLYYIKGMGNIIPSFDDFVEKIDIEAEKKKYERFCECYKYLAIRIVKGLNYEKQILDPCSEVPSIMFFPCYADALSTWYKTFSDKNRLLILSFEEMIQSSQNTVDQVMDFIEKPRFKLETEEAYKPTDSYDSKNNPKMKQQTKEKLGMLFKPYNEKFYNLTGRDFGWD